MHRRATTSRKAESQGIWSPNLLGLELSIKRLSSGIYYHKSEKGFPNRKMIQPPYGFPEDYDALSESELANANFDMTRMVAPRVELVVYP